MPEKIRPEIVDAVTIKPGGPSIDAKLTEIRELIARGFERGTEVVVVVHAWSAS